MTNKKNSFNFFCPAELHKAKDDNGNDVMKVKGIASTADEDSDGEFLDPQGFVLDEFLEIGLVNWHHGVKDKPSTVIGEPTLAEIRPEGLYVECDLYKSSAMAREVFELAEVMSKDSQTRKLGYSIEGSVLERKSNDKKSPDYNIITKALITGLAITHMPKNGKTFCDILKGKTNEEIQEEEDEIEKDLSTTSGSAVIRASVDPHLKNVVCNYEFKRAEEEEQYDKIFKSFPDITIEKAERVYAIITKIEQDMNNKTVTDDQLEKAMAVLGLGLENGENDFVKAKSGEEMTAEEIADAMETKSQKKVEITAADDTEIEAEEEGEGGGEIKKGQPTNFLRKALEQSSLENSALGVMINEVLKDNREVKMELKKAIETIGTLSGSVKESVAQVQENIGRQPQGRKSILKSNPYVVPREKASFAKAETEEAPTGQILSKSNNYNQVLNLLDTYCDEKGMRADLSKAVMDFEAVKTLPMTIVAELKRELGITIVD